MSYHLPTDTSADGEGFIATSDRGTEMLTHPARLVAHSGNFDNGRSVASRSSLIDRTR
jgi:hypothetical protein